MKREFIDYVNDVLDATDKIESFIKGMSYEEFEKDDKTVFAVMRALEIIGEAVKNIPEDLRKNYPQIPWKGMAGMRDKVIHNYFGVNLKLVWETINHRIQEIKPLFQELKKDLKGEEK